ncbi:hypothetical protein [Aquimarina litoralis]|uniref:hypothetical protein n=1 Tax=Aquimarina litoralis TaxID=584605 RepID=UPI001C56F190|nr:hypothetical protein [Aquimarina litoralis]MBW1297804.1 hypothetical protein [Aquimarina litoralis]
MKKNKISLKKATISRLNSPHLIRGGGDTDGDGTEGRPVDDTPPPPPPCGGIVSSITTLFR